MSIPLFPGSFFFNSLPGFLSVLALASVETIMLHLKFRDLSVEYMTPHIDCIYLRIVQGTETGVMLNLVARLTCNIFMAFFKIHIGLHAFPDWEVVRDTWLIIFLNIDAYISCKCTACVVSF